MARVTARYPMAEFEIIDGDVTILEGLTLTSEDGIEAGTVVAARAVDDGTAVEIDVDLAEGAEFDGEWILWH